MKRSNFGFLSIISAVLEFRVVGNHVSAFVDSDYPCNAGDIAGDCLSSSSMEEMRLSVIDVSYEMRVYATI